MKLCRCLTLIVFVLSVAGCGKRGPALYKVVGTVQWKGEPVEQGNIIFEPFDRETHPQAAKIVGGKYQLRIGAGKMKVQIFASREQPGKINPDMNTPVLEHYIPPEYNRRTTLEAEVLPQDDNNISFDLPPAAG
jgi:hypothetical protein